MLRIAKRTLGGKLLPRFNLRPVRPPGVRFPRAFHFAKRVACARGTHYRQRPRVGQELEGNKRRGNDRRIYDRCQTNAELLLLFPFSPPPPRTVFVSPFYWLAQDRSPSGSYYYQRSFGSSLLSAFDVLPDVFIRLLVCWRRMGSWRGWKIAM